MENNLDLIFIKLDKKVIVSDKIGHINENFSIDFSLIVEQNVKFDLFEIITHISNNIYKFNDEFEISKKNENYEINNKAFKIDYFLDELLIEFFSILKKKFYAVSKTNIYRLILIYDFTPYDIRLIIQQAALINGIDIIHMIDTNRALRFYIESSKNRPKTLNKYLAIIIKYNEYIELAIYISEPIKKIFYSYKKAPNFFEDLMKLEKKNDDFILYDIFHEKKSFKKLKDYISNEIYSEMGNQNFQDIGQIFIFDSSKVAYFNKMIFFGTAKSLDSKKTQQCKAIFKVIDKNVASITKKLTKISIMNYKFNIEINQLPILLDIDIPFNGCFYTTVNLGLSNEDYEYSVLITVYFNQINYFYISLNLFYCNSIEFIFYKNFPEISFVENEYKSIKCEEKFEDEEHFKRICLINVNRKKLKLNLNLNEYKNIFSSELDYESKNISVIVGQNLKILSFFQKRTFIDTKIWNEIYSLIDLVNKFNSKLSYKELESLKFTISEMYYLINENIFNNIIFTEFKEIEEDILIKFILAFGKYRIIKKIFIEDEPILVVKINEDNYKKFIYLSKQLESFHQKCKTYIKNNDLMVAKLFLTASIAFEDYLKSKDYSETKEDLIDLIDFKKEGTIYNSAYENNLNFIMDLNKESFLYPIFLQFNSGFKNQAYYKGKVSTCMISKITLQQIKLDLIKSLDLYGIRIFFQTIYFADTVLSTGITIYNEKRLFDKKLSNEDLLTKNDTNFQKRTSISFLQKHERFSHLKKIINKNEPEYIDSPIGYIDFSLGQILFLSSKNDIQNSGKGEVIEYFLSNGNRQLIDNLYQCRDKNFNFKNIFNIDLLLYPANKQLINELKNIPEDKKKEQDNIIKSTINNKIDNSKYSINYSKKNFYYTDEYIEAKNKLKNEDKFRKFTFARNTIIRCKLVNNELIPDEDL